MNWEMHLACNFQCLIETEGLLKLTGNHTYTVIMVMSCLDLIWCDKIVFSLVDMTCDDLSFCHPTVTYGHAYKIYKTNCMGSIRAHFFAK